jgi:bacillithiol biosynthesis deacetylase BshB1
METTLQHAEILAIGAHPDDVDLGCAGTLAKMAEAGRRVGVIDLTAGEMGTRGDKETRLRESHASAEILGLAFRACLFLPDTRLEHNSEYEKKIVEALRTIRPRILMVNLGFDTHPDHIAAAELVSSAWHKAGFGKYDSPLKPFRPERLVRYFLGQETVPSFVVDVSGQIEKRRKAIAAFKSQFFHAKTDALEGKTRLSTPHFLDLLETRLKYFGNRILKPYGEPFVIKELPEIGDPALLTDMYSVFRD